MPLIMQSALHQPGRRNRFHQMLGDQGIDCWNAGVDDRNACARLDDLLQQVLHDHLRPRAVERPDERSASTSSHNRTTGVESPLTPAAVS